MLAGSRVDDACAALAAQRERERSGSLEKRVGGRRAHGALRRELLLREARSLSESAAMDSSARRAGTRARAGKEKSTAREPCEPRISLTPLDDDDDPLALSKAPSRSHEQPVLFIALTLHLGTLVLLQLGAQRRAVQGRLGLERVLQRLVDLDLDLGLSLLLLGARAAGDALRLGEAGADGLRAGEREE